MRSATVTAGMGDGAHWESSARIVSALVAVSSVIPTLIMHGNATITGVERSSSRSCVSLPAAAAASG